MLIYVLNKDGKPLMPTQRWGKVKSMLKERKAKVVRQTPFTIQLKYEIENPVLQEVSLGVDTGSKVIGVSATTKTKVLFEAKIELRKDISDNLTQRRTLRRTHRSHKTRYRKARFNNRDIKEGWLAPSIRNKIEEHKKAVRLVCSILPIKKIVYEKAKFDIQKLNNPDIKGIEYQQGNMLGYYNIREYILSRDNYTCQCCKKKNKILNVHHIKQRKDGGSNKPDNLITLCVDRHQKYHRGEVKIKFKKSKSYSDATQTNIVVAYFRKWLIKNYRGMIKYTFGYRTKFKRKKYKLEKDHHLDARCISGNPKAINEFGTVYYFRKVRRHNRQIHKLKINKGGTRKLNQQSYKVFGFRLFDKVRFNNQICFITGRRANGSFALKDINYEKVTDSINYKKLNFICSARGYMVDVL